MIISDILKVGDGEMESSLLDVIGPIMVGPSSSHTAGAVRLGNIARHLAEGNFQRVDFYLHGSFAKTYKGHGTDKALLGGVLGMLPSDESIRDSEEIAARQGIQFLFHTEDLGNVHPNTVRIVLTRADSSTIEMTGSSIGGGNVLVTSINHMKLEFTGQYPTLVTLHQDKPGVLSKVSTVLSRHGINIAFMRVFRQLRGKEASMVIETDQPVNADVLSELHAIEEISKILFVDAI